MTMRPFSIGAAPLPSMMRTLSSTTPRICTGCAAAIDSAVATTAVPIIHRSDRPMSGKRGIRRATRRGSMALPTGIANPVVMPSISLSRRLFHDGCGNAR